MRCNRLARVCVTLLLVGAVSVATPMRTVALTQFGSTPCGGFPQNCVQLSWSGSGTQTVCGGTAGNLAVEVNWVMANSYTNTDTEWSRSCADPRVVIAEVSVPSTGLWAWVNCPPGVATYAGDPVQQCQTTYLSINTTQIDPIGGNPNMLAVMMCHEFGHTVGLRHPISVPGNPAAGCMRTPFVSQSWYLTSGDKSALRNTYA